MDFGVGFPRFHLVKHWTLVGLNCYLFFSLNFVGIFAQETPHRISNHNYSRGQRNFRASPFDASKHHNVNVRIVSNSNPFPHQAENSIDLSQIPSAVPQKLHENSIDRFDAYGDYEYIDLDQHPKPIQYHKPLRYRPQGPEQPYVGRPQEPQRRVDYNRPPTPSHYYQGPYRPNPYVPGHVPRPSSGGFFSNIFNPFSIDKNDNLQNPAEDENLFDPLLKLIGLKKTETELRVDNSQYSQFHDPLEYDYGDYLEGYQNYVKPQRPATVPERIAKWFNGFKIPSGKRILKPAKRVETQQSLDYSQYETGDDENLIFYNNQQQRPSSINNAGLYDFGDVVQSIRNNETTGEVVKKFLSAAAALSERSDSNPVFMMWTIPTTILALMGVVYFVGALAIIGYKYTLQGGNANLGALVSMAVVFSIPLLLGFAIVGTRSSINGELQVNRLVRGDVRGSMRQDFDGVDFFMDAVFGSSALLGIGWLVSITV